MRKPYVVTIHDMASLLFDTRRGWRNNLRQYRFRRGLMRAERVIAVSAATRRDVVNLMGVQPERIRLVYSAPSPEFFQQRHTADTAAQEQLRVLERYQIRYPFLLYAGAIRPQKNIPRLGEAFAIARTALTRRPEHPDPRLIIIRRQISRYPTLPLAAIQSPGQREVQLR